MIRRLLGPLGLGPPALGSASALLVVAAAVAAVLGAPARTVGALVAVAMLLAGVAVVLTLKRGHDSDPDDEPRAVKGPGLRRRKLIGSVGAGLAAVTVAVLAVPAAQRAERATRALRGTPWRSGSRVVDDRGDVIRIDDVQPGELLTVWPEGHVGANDAQAVLLRESPDRLVVSPERADWTPGGFVAYSKLCTHMACPVGLYQQSTGSLVCPCHQAVFDALDGGKVLQGPARRPLPQLPLAVENDVLVARGDFSDAVGTGFWFRP